MQDLIDKGRNLTVGTWLKLILLAQVALAGLLIAVDINARWSFETASDEPRLNTPVSPGDQLRRYDPTGPRPFFPNPEITPSINLPDNVPPRLEFTFQEHPSFGGLLVAQGQITGGDADRFEAYVSTLNTQPDGVAINSPGGIVEEALQVGKLIRDHGLNTLILPGTICLSSCPYVIAGGVERSISRTGFVGLHQHYYETPGYMPVFMAVEGIQHGQGNTMRHLIEMGVDPGLMIYSLATPPNDIYILVESELIESQLATAIID